MHRAVRSHVRVHDVSFRRLHAHGLDWIFKFSELSAIRFEKPDAPPSIADYDPSASFAAGEERKKNDDQFAKL